MNNLAYRSCLFLLPVLLCAMPAASLSQKSNNVATSGITNIHAAHYVDPDILDSEWNHHVAGYALIASAVLYLIGQSVPGLSWSRPSWILLLIAAALFLALWSDKEIWPRGTLNWMWLIHHDAEARQHKIYAILLFAIALVEYFRQAGRLGRPCGTWAFPALAFLGACLLLMHTHDGHSGLPAGWDDAAKEAKIIAMAGPGEAAVPTHFKDGRIDAVNESGAGNSPGQMQGMSMPAPQPGAQPPTEPAWSGSPAHHHHSGMMMGIAHIEEQHLWFAGVGMALAFFKWADDGQFWRGKFIRYLWPCSMLVLGVLLVLYTEVK